MIVIIDLYSACTGDSHKNFMSDFSHFSSIILRNRKNEIERETWRRADNQPGIQSEIIKGNGMSKR